MPDPDTATVCNRRFTTTSAPRSGPNDANAWYFGTHVPDSMYVASGGGQPGGDYPVTITVDSAITDIQIVWQFTPPIGGKVVLFDAQNVALDSLIITPADLEPSPYEAVVGYHTQVSRAFGARGVRRIRVEAPGSGGSASWIMLQVFFRPDTPPCPPTGDSILDDRSIREFLVSQWDASFRLQRELTGWIVRDSATGALMALPDPLSPTSLCTAPVRFPFPMEGVTPVAYYHTHAATAGQSLLCPGRFSTTVATRGPSYFDFSASDAVFPDGQYYPSYVIDALFVYRLRRNELAMEWAWHTANGCR